MKDLHTLDKYRVRGSEVHFFGAPGDSGNGCFKVFVRGRSFYVIASNGGGWEHVSISPGSDRRKSCPTWDEMCAIKDMFFRPDECVVQYHPAATDYINLHPYCLHLWRPVEGTFPTPPKEFV